MKNTNWTSTNIPDQKGKNILITGATSGLGLEAAIVLNQKGANVIMAVRNLEKGREVIAKIKSKRPEAILDLMQLDLADLNSIHKFSDEFHAKYSSLNVLINNAGIMFPTKREETKQKFEIQFGTNHLGHFALTGLLLDVIKNTPQSRVVTQSSIMHKVNADIHFDDLNWEKSYDKAKAYSQSKLANLLFAYELDRQFKEHNINAISVAAHPGYTATNLQNTSGLFIGIANKLIAQNVEIGVMPILRASTEENIFGGEYYGPTKMREMRGFPEKVKSSDNSYDIKLAKDLWNISEKLTSVHFDF
jgi:NAD(P)-dependent dehydrogenase (short-subunit alcohol dehydrogenase family)